MLFNPTLHPVTLITTQNTSIMTSGKEKTQGSIATYSYLPYGLFIVTGYYNPIVGRENRVSARDLEKMKIALWQEINSKNTRSKNSQTSRLLIEVEYTDNYSKITDLEERIVVKGGKEYRSFKEIKPDLNLEPLLDSLIQNREIIKEVRIHLDPASFSKEEFKKLEEGGVPVRFFVVKGLEIKEI
jgi:CRISPR-associated protein Csh2